MGTNRERGIAAAVVWLTLGVFLSFVPAVRPAEPPGPEPKEVGVRGEVARGAAEGACVIRVCFGKKKVIVYEVAPESPKARELSGLLGKTVEVTGQMRKGARGENQIVVSSIAEPSEVTVK